MEKRPDVEIQLKENEVEIQVYYKTGGKPMTQIFEFDSLKFIDEKGNLVLKRF